MEGGHGALEGGSDWATEGGNGDDDVGWTRPVMRAKRSAPLSAIRRRRAAASLALPPFVAIPW